MEASHLFANISSKFQCVQDSHRQAMAAALLGPKDVLLFFSYSGSTKDILDTMSIARQRECRSILITHFPKSPGAVYADVVLQCGATEGPLQMGSVAARIAQLYIVDALYQEFCRRDPAAAERNRAAVAEPWCASIFEELLRQAAFRSKGPPAQGGRTVPGSARA